MFIQVRQEVDEGANLYEQVSAVVPLCRAERLPAESRGRGTSVFQLLLTLGFVLNHVGAHESCVPQPLDCEFQSQSFTIQPHGRAKRSLSIGRGLPACNTTPQTRLRLFLSKPLSA